MVEATASPILHLIRRVVDDHRVPELPDQELLRRFHAQQDQAAFHALLRRHGPMVLDVCRSVLGHDAEDAFQATFLVLARKAGSIRKAEALASWLHGVAYRTALKARAQSATRQKHEARAGVRPTPEGDDLNWREVRQVVHEELNGLPERYRAPLVLCYLEGATQEAIAVQLRLPRSTLRERLERGRALLRTRLVRRGLGPIALLAAAAWPAANASASVPSSVTASTVKAAGPFAAGQAVTGVLSDKVAALTEGVLQSMFTAKLKIATALVFALGLLLGGIGALSHLAAAGPVEPTRNEAPKTADANPDRAPEFVRAPEEAEVKPAEGLATAARADDITLESASAVVVKTVPEAGAGEVDPKLTEIKVTFSKDMQDGSWSWVTLSKESFPTVDGKAKYLADKRTCVLPVKLEPGKTYAIWVNNEQYGNFKDTDGRSAVPYLLVFKTKK